MKWRQWRRAAQGFTIIEILISLLIGSVITVSLGAILIDMIETESREASLNEVRQELQSAMNFIIADLSQATFVYDGDCLQGSGLCANSNGSARTPITSYLPNFGANIRPILAMWILEHLPYDNNPAFVMPTNCPPENTTCLRIQNSRRSYTLVVYYLDTNTSSEWQGAARLRRYQLRQYATINGTNITQTPGYVDPTENTNFVAWPLNINTGANLQATSPSNDLSNLPVVADFIDGNWSEVDPTPIACQGEVTNPRIGAYVRTPLETTTPPNSFYGCVLSRGSNFNTATFVYLRANPRGKPAIRPQDEAVRPVLTTTVLSRGVYQKVPSN
ncbi:prepilin-type N-terminal cleavage/methylation domain-containing protein [Thermosynechococcus sp. QKsg1]|uniref:prepilin-type N-terminal cleavage/methylation domain-containing protein n=1 Tax=unclassified Thermosynechococcus TaxID=2622553 RepID=UPI00122DF03A|nr:MULTISPECIES: prepilin-type N-terminal cleavage/methylation domain-containing protein [unclassified Thermosynechococcus]QEQ01745.1 prepilin-type N-terminal cleavage/methylation domain-containing protein [Thermosynechococcus sp. CL-1]WJI26128.1 prepilin-type N-terminal cleavage/methylation domain-containing protein [Thermosynechococcus sp. B1]WJI28653.1 prepilin-type N-terminal cleavage/methylation domain-containing protein [Thermosynechococcus sp. B3]WNC86246.1 prepilin-type N-terminal cleav